MATIYDDIKKQFNTKLKEKREIEKVENNLHDSVFDMAVDVLLKQVKALRKKHFEESRNEKTSSANELIKSIDQQIERTI